MWYDIWTLRKFPGIFTTQMSISSIIPKQNAKKVSQNDIPSAPYLVVNNSNLINELWLQYFCWLDFSSFFLHSVKLVCRLNFVSYYLMKIDPVWYYQASVPMTCIFCYMFMQVYFLSTLDLICVIHIWVRLNVEILAVRPDNSAYRKPKIMKIGQKLRILLTSLLSIFYLRNPVLKENYDR